MALEAVGSRPTTRPSKFFELKALRDSRAARYTFTDSTDEQRARELLTGMLVSLEETKAITATPDTNTGGLTFKTLAAQYSAHKVKPAQHRNDRKVTGMRSVRTVACGFASFPPFDVIERSGVFATTAPFAVIFAWTCNCAIRSLFCYA